MKSTIVTLMLLAGFAASVVALIVHFRSYPFPNQEGYQPQQPITFSHKLHAGDLEISCLYCHSSASKSPHAGIPAADLCMNCHRLVTANWDATRAELDKARAEGRPPKRVTSAELRKLYNALGLNEQLQPEAGKGTEPIQWVKVHNLPEYTRFDHRPHVNAKLACQDCHGPVQTMEVMRQSANLSMGWCLKCHKEHKEIDGRKVSPSTDCAVCHY